MAKNRIPALSKNSAVEETQNTNTDVLEKSDGGVGDTVSQINQDVTTAAEVVGGHSLQGVLKIGEKLTFPEMRALAKEIMTHKIVIRANGNETEVYIKIATGYASLTKASMPKKYLNPYNSIEKRVRGQIFVMQEMGNPMLYIVLDEMRTAVLKANKLIDEDGDIITFSKLLKSLGVVNDPSVYTQKRDFLNAVKEQFDGQDPIFNPEDIEFVKDHSVELSSIKVETDKGMKEKEDELGVFTRK
jgi:hypothetical protein